MPIDFDEINSGFEFDENDTVSAEDLGTIVKSIYDARNSLVTISSNYKSFSTKSKNALPTVKNSLDATLKRNTEYFIGIQENLILKFPTDFADIFDEEATISSDQPRASDIIFVQFISGENPTNITVYNTTSDLVNFFPLKNKVCEIEAVCGYKPNGNLGWFLVARQFDAVVE
jgi:hypothetical protein